MMLTKTRSVMELTDSDGFFAIFVTYDDDHPLLGVARRIVSLDRTAWIDMGEPQTITVTIEPGDTLND